MIDAVVPERLPFDPQVWYGVAYTRLIIGASGLAAGVIP